MSDKYIIKNCPCRMELHENDCFGHTGYNNCCACTDCLFKQIVELCKEQLVISCNIDGKEQILKAYYHTHLGDKILELLDIEEVE